MKVPKIALYRRGQRWWCRFQWDGERLRWPAGGTEEEAETFKARLILAMTEGTFTGKREDVGIERRTTPKPKKERRTLDEILDLFLSRHARGKKSEDFYKHTVSAIRRGFGNKVDSPVHRITAEDCEDLMAERRAQVEVATANRTLRILKMAFDAAVRWGYTSKNPAADLKLVREENEREFFATKEQFEILVSRCPEWLRQIVITAAYTGARRGELLGLIWTEVDLKANRIRFRHTKAKRDRTVPISARLKQVLKAMPNRSPAGFVFNPPGAPGKRLSPDTLRSAFDTAVRAIDLRQQVVDRDGEVKDQWFRFHDLRHTFASWQVSGGGDPRKAVPLNTVRKLLGHQDLKMTLRYAHLAPEHLEAAVGVLDDMDNSSAVSGLCLNM